MNGEISPAKAERYAIRYKSDVDGKIFKMTPPEEHPKSLLIVGLIILALVLFHGL